MKLYEEVRKRLAAILESVFGPNDVCVPSKPVEEMTEDESKV